MKFAIVEALLDVKKVKIEAWCEAMLNDDMDAYDILDEMTMGLREIGKGYRERYFDAELMVSGWNAKKALQILRPLLQEKVKPGNKPGKIVIGTVKGDVHDIGKEIVYIMLSSAGFTVIDLGTDVGKEEYAERVQKAGADILAMSALLTTTRDYMTDVIEYIKKKGLEVKTLVGGGAISEEYAKEIGADAYGHDAVDAVTKARELLNKKS
jgi:5-methyltetrahydrofolate--homocysteine methyltransferase